MMRSTVLAASTAALLAIFQGTAIGDRDIPEDFLNNPVLVELSGEGGGTSLASGFYYATKSNQYFVTARHVLFDSTDGKWNFTTQNAVLRSYSGSPDSSKLIVVHIDLQKLYKAGLIKRHQQHDIAVVLIGHIVNGLEMEFVEGVYRTGVSDANIMVVRSTDVKPFKEVLVGNEVYIFGYPSSIGLKKVPRIEYEKPLLRRGVISGKNMRDTSLILDCPVYYGNSGGPVVEVEHTQTMVKYRIIGVVSEFIPFAEEWFNVTHRYSNFDISNSGYSVAVPIDFALELMNE